MIFSLLKLAEIQTKLASQLPLLLGTVYALWRYDDFNLLHFLFMFLSLLTFDMATTVTNNYMDYKKAIKTSGYGYEEHNAMVRDKLSETTALLFLVILLIIAVTFGILLWFNTSIVVLLLGALSFGIGIIYSFGPVPISRTPFGELFSGGTMGFIIPFLAVYIHVYPFHVFDISIDDGLFNILINLDFIISIFFLSIAPVLTIANIMLANNLCDMEDDIINKRYTLPIYIGKAKALRLYKYLYYIIYIGVAIGCLLQKLPLLCLFVFLTLPVVNKGIAAFQHEQKKATTFAIAIKNLVLINGALIILLFLSIFIK